MFEPVSPSGTGKTLSALTSSTRGLEARGGGAEGAEQARAVARAAGHQARPTCGDGLMRRPSRCRRGRTARGPAACGGGRRLAARMQLELRDADRQPVDLAPERRPDRVSDRVIHLSRDLRDRQAVGDPEVQPDRERPARDGDAQAAGALLDPAQHSIGPVAGEAGDAVRPERDAAHDVDHGTARHERPTADEPSGTDPPSCAPRATPGSARGAWYSTAPLGPDRRERLL